MIDGEAEKRKSVMHAAKGRNEPIPLKNKVLLAQKVVP